MQFYEMIFCQIISFKLYTVNNKYDDDKIDDQIRGKSQMLSEVLE